MPDLSGKTCLEAETTLNDSGFTTWELWDETLQPIESYTDGCTITYQTPAAGETVDQNANIVLAAPQTVQPASEDQEQEPAKQIGETVSVTGMDLKVTLAEAKKTIPGNEFTGDITPAEGRSLHEIDLEIVNTGDNKIDPCPLNDVLLYVFDTDGKEMSQNDSSWDIEGNDCGKSLLNGESGAVKLAYDGVEGAKVGHIEIIDVMANFETYTVQVAAK